MRLAIRPHHRQPPSHPGISGRARVDKRTKRLTGRLEPGDIAIIDHENLDRVAAEALIERSVGAVLNAAPSTAGRFPNLGPQILVDHGTVLVDALGPAIMQVREGSLIHLDAASGEVFGSSGLISTGKVATVETVAAAMERAREGLTSEMAAFAENTLSFIRAEGETFLEPHDVSAIRTQMRGRPVLIVVRGYHYQEDLAVLRSYVKEYRPVIIGVDGGADAVLATNLKPDLIIGDMDSVSNEALRCGAELVVHAYRDGNAPGAARLDRLGLPYVTFAIAGTSEDAAMVVADDLEAELIVAVGTHMTLIEFLDKGRLGMASTFLTRLRVGGKLVDAKGVSQLYRSRIGGFQLTALGLVGFLALFAALSVTAGGRAFLNLIWAHFDDFAAWLKGLV